MRIQYERNTGAFVDLVFEDSAAFFSNVLPGDVIISVDGTSIMNTKHAQEIMAKVSSSAPSSQLVVLRKGKKKIIEVKF
jgi:S1-C subfamily serine protease